MDPEKHVQVAVHLAKPPSKLDSEASYRGACGRAYYAAFGVACMALREAGLHLVDSGKAHGQAIDYLKRSADKELVKCGSILGELHAVRNSADYDVGGRPLRGDAFDSFQARRMIVKSHTIINALRSARVKALPQMAISLSATTTGQ